jgi:hypothetical protein
MPNVRVSLAFFLTFAHVVRIIIVINFDKVRETANVYAERIVCFVLLWGAGASWCAVRGYVVTPGNGVRHCLIFHGRPRTRGRRDRFQLAWLTSAGGRSGSPRLSFRAAEGSPG